MRQQLIAEGLELEEVGGSIQVVETAAPKGKGLLDLEEALMLQVVAVLTSLLFIQNISPLYLVLHARFLLFLLVEPRQKCVHTA